IASTGRAADSAIPKISACWVLESLHSCHIQESLDSNVGAFLRLYNLGVASTGRAADSPYRKSARVGCSNFSTPAIFKKASTAMSGLFYIGIIVVY
ncbi:hypothetical protein, partial [Photobacterium phosphoreum]|uniref:hypothetical protein n=1 Tax=Photobacterium phosphoreum TaxID=659 RepID=UPI0039B04866